MKTDYKPYCKLAELSIICMFFFISCSATSPKKTEGAPPIHTKTIKVYADQSAINGDVSLYLPEIKKASNILYFFHGDAGNSESWHGFSSILKPLADNYGIAIASVSFGPKWFIVLSEEQNPYHILNTDFTENIMPQIESYISIEPLNRIVCGFSMGGYNAAQLAYHSPELFSQVIMISPSILPIYPYDSDETISEYITISERKLGSLKQTLRKLILGRSRIESSINYVLSFQKKRFPTESAWDKNNMLKYVLTTKRNYPSTYISSGIHDINAFFDGNEKLYRKLLEYGTDVTFIPINGGHLSRDEESLRDFIISHLH